MFMRLEKFGRRQQPFFTCSAKIRTSAAAALLSAFAAKFFATAAQFWPLWDTAAARLYVSQEEHNWRLQLFSMNPDVCSDSLVVMCSNTIFLRPAAQFLGICNKIWVTAAAISFCLTVPNYGHQLPRTVLCICG